MTLLTFPSDSHNGSANKGSRRKDSAALFISRREYFEDLSNEAHISAEQSRACTPSRFPPAYVDRRWSQHPERTPRTWPQEAVCLIGDSEGKEAAMQPYAIMKKRADFLAANRGKRYATPGFVLLVRDRADNDTIIRLGITITKKVGNAVVRNRMRRRFRALAQEMLAAKGKTGADHVLIGRDGGIERDFAELRADLEKALIKLCSQSRSSEPVEARSSDKRPSTSPGLR